MVREYRARLKNNRTVLVKEKEYAYGESTTLSNPEIVVEIMKSVFEIHTEADEQLYLAVMNVKNDLIGIVKVSSGGMNTSLVPIKEILRDVLILGGASFVLIHNHPSGDPTPSAEDIRSAKMLATAAAAVELSFHDSIIVGSGYASLKDLGVLS